MKVELPSGGWVILRERLMSADKFAVQNAVKMELDTSTGLQHAALGMINSMRNELLKLLIEQWSFEGVPVPRDHFAGSEAIGTTLDLDDYNALAQAVEPMLNKVVNTSPNPTAPSPSSSPG